MLISLEEIDNFHSLARSEYDTQVSKENARKRAKDKIKAEKWAEDRKNFESMISFKKALKERHEVLERIQDRYHAHDPYIAEELYSLKHNKQWYQCDDPISALLFNGWQPKYPPLTT